MKALGVLLLISGLIGLLLSLIFWIPAKFNMLITLLLCVICLVAVWGGGRLAQPKTEPILEVAGRSQPMSLPAPLMPPRTGTFCPKCGCQVMPGQQFCGGCGSNLVSYCARCGNALSEPSKFCGRCGTRLS